MWNIIFHSFLLLHWWPYTTLAVLVCVRSRRARPYSELWPRSALRTVVDGPPCQTLSLSYHSGPHTFKWTHFVITSSHRNIIEVSCVGTCVKLHMLLTQCVCVWVCTAALLLWQTASSLCHSAWTSQRTVFIKVFLEKYWRIMIPKMS